MRLADWLAFLVFVVGLIVTLAGVVASAGWVLGRLLDQIFRSIGLFRAVCLFIKARAFSDPKSVLIQRIVELEGNLAVLKATKIQEAATQS